MAYTTRKLILPIVFALAKAFNAFKKEVSLGVATAKVHADITSKPGTDTNEFSPTRAQDAIASANASDLATSVTLVNEIKAVLNRHYADTNAHKVAFAAIATADATDLATGETLANAIKASYE